MKVKRDRTKIALLSYVISHLADFRLYFQISEIKKVILSKCRRPNYQSNLPLTMTFQFTSVIVERAFPTRLVSG